MPHCGEHLLQRSVMLRLWLGVADALTHREALVRVCEGRPALVVWQCDYNGRSQRPISTTLSCRSTSGYYQGHARRLRGRSPSSRAARSRRQAGDPLLEPVSTRFEPSSACWAVMSALASLRTYRRGSLCERCANRRHMQRRKTASTRLPRRRWRAVSAES
jgi:hypothetical protein